MKNLFNDVKGYKGEISVGFNLQHYIFSLMKYAS